MHKYIYLFCLLLVSPLSGFAQKEVKTPLAKQTLSVSDQRRFDHFFYEAMNAKATDKYDVAFDYLQFCHKIDSTNANVLYELGVFSSSLQKPSLAMDYYRKATEYDTENVYYRMSYANLCLQLKQYSDAIEQYEEIVKRTPDKSEVYLYLAEAYRADGNLPKAISALDKLERNIGLNDQISLQKFQLYAMLGQENKGFEEIQKYIDKNPTNIKSRILLGNLYLSANKPKDALKVYTEARQLEPDNPYLISSMAEYYEFVDNKEAAENELKTAILSPAMDIDTKLGILAQYVGTLQQNNKSTEVATPLFSTLMELHPQEPKLNLMYGNLLLIQGEKQEAYSQFRTFAEAHPTDPTGWEQMLAASFPDSLKQAMQTCEQAIVYLPEEPQFYFYLGIGQYFDKEYAKALTTLKKGVVHVDEGNLRLLSDFNGQMGDLYYQLNQVDSAFATYDQALLYNPQNVGVLNNYSYYLSLLKKDLDRAEKMSGITVKAEPTNPTYLDTYGWVLFEQGAFTMAKIYLEKAVNYTIERGEEPSREVLEHYGDVLYKTGEEEEALVYWLKARAADTEPAPVLEKKIKTKKYIDIKGNNGEKK